MAASGFEGFEKRLELRFIGDDPQAGPLGLRLLDFDALERVLDVVQCTVVSAVANEHFDAYVLSESSLFVYPTKIIIKTCGTTQLLRSIRPLTRHARSLGLGLASCRYTRGSFIFPEAQPFPHTSFNDEVGYIEQSLPKALCYRKSSVLPSSLSTHSWHVFTASTTPTAKAGPTVVEVCMTELDRDLARSFYRRKGGAKTTGGDSAGSEMTRRSGISAINPSATVCDFAFDPCGYSMNGVDEERYSTIHVTPEEGFSYASFECVVASPDDLPGMLGRVVEVFGPGKVSVATTHGSGEEEEGVADTLASLGRALGGKLGLKCRSRVVDDFAGVGTIVYQMFTSTRRK